jgi:hypothetical protein
MRITRRSYQSCPLVDEFHIQNVLGSCEKRQWIIGARVNIPSGATKALTYAALTGGLWDTIDHAQILLQFLNFAPADPPYVISKASAGFTLYGEPGDYSVVILATLPNRPKATAKWAKDYCPYCKNLGFNAICGSALKDIAVFGGVALTSGGTVAVDFPTLTKTSIGQTGTGSNYPESEQRKEKGSQRASLVSMMKDNTYQIILTKSTDGGIATPVTVYPFPSAITVDGFTITGDTAEYYDVLIVGQVNF